MKFTIETKTLSAALGAVGIAADSRMSLPILGSVLLSAEEGRLTLAATNLDIYVTETTGAEVQEQGEAVVAFKLIHLFISRIGSAKVAAVLEDGRLHLSAGETEAILETLPANEFPPNLQFEPVAQITVVSEELLNPLRMVAHAMSTDESRYLLMGVCLKSGRKGLEFIATTGNILGLYRSDIPAEGVEAVLPADAVRTILRNVKGDQATLLIGETAFSVVSADSEIRGKLIEGRYPQYEALIPKVSKEAFSAQTTELEEAIKTASLFLATNEIGVSVTGRGKKELEVSCGGRFRHKLLGADLEGQPDRSIRFDYRLMGATIGALKNEQVRIELPENGSQFAKVCEGDFTGVIGLLRVNIQ